MGIITLALVSAGLIPGGPDLVIPPQVIIISATAISLGTAAGGWRIMKTMGHKVVELEPITGFAAETTAATVIYTAAHFGMPVSTTHVISSAIMGVGTSKGARGVRWGVARSILIAWVVTIPAAAVVGALSWLVLDALGIT
jgi:PiT family inorganic phosphate transporter